MGCVICGLPTGDACVPLCAVHMPLSELAGDIEFGVRSDWPFGHGLPTHLDYMTDTCGICGGDGDCGHPEHSECCVCRARALAKVQAHDGEGEGA